MGEQSATLSYRNMESEVTHNWLSLETLKLMWKLGLEPGTMPSPDWDNHKIAPRVVIPI